MLSQKDKDKKLLELIKKHPNKGMNLLMNEYGFQKILVNGDSSKNCKTLICGEDRSEYCICPLATKEEINSLLFTDPIYIIKDCGSMMVNLYR